MTAELYHSDCCGAVFAAGSASHDEIHEAVAGDVLTVEIRDRHPDDGEGALHTSERWERTHRVSRDEARQFDAIRAGDCPACETRTPGMTLLSTTQNTDGGEEGNE